MAKSIGIDFGNTQSIVSYYDSERDIPPIPLLLEKNNDSLQTVIGRNEGQKTMYVGLNALEQSVNLQNYYLHRYFKNDITKDHSLKFHNTGERTIKLNAQRFTLIYFRYLFAKTKQLLLNKGISLNDCTIVVTKPIDFNEKQIGYLQLALVASGFGKDIMYIDEPVAAAWHYCQPYNREEFPNFENGLYCFYDFGGGTFDCCIMKLDDSGFYPYVLKADKMLGGRNIDAKIAQQLLSRYWKIEFGKLDDIFNNPDYSYILGLAEEIKLDFSNNQNKDLFFKIVNFQGKQCDIEFSRQLFNEAVSEIIKNTITITSECINDARAKYEKTVSKNNFIKPEFKIKKVILVGGSSELPSVKEQIAQTIGIEPINIVKFDPFHAISKGAAIYGAKINTGEIDGWLYEQSNFGFGIIVRKNGSEIAKTLLHPDGSVNQTGRAELFLPSDINDGLVEVIQFKDEKLLNLNDNSTYSIIYSKPLLANNNWWQNKNRSVIVELIYTKMGEVDLKFIEPENKREPERNSKIERELSNSEILNELNSFQQEIRIEV